MSKLNHYKFSNLYKMSSGISSKPEQAGHGAPFLSFSTVFNSYFLPEKLPDKMDTSEEEQRKYSIKAGDIFLTRTSEVIDELGMSSVALKDYPNATYSGFLKRLRPTQDNITYPKFMAFYLRSLLFRKTMTNNAVLTLRASLNEGIFSYLDLLLPNFNDQVKAGDLLYLMNQKIECNNRINAELEAMVKTLYDYWFVQFDFPDAHGKPYKSSGGKMLYNPTLKREIPAGWDCKPLSHFLHCNKNRLGKKHELAEIRYLDTANLTKNVIDSIQPLVIGKDEIPSRANMIVKKNDILYSTVRPNQCHYGLIKNPIENMIASTGFAVLSHKENPSLNDIFYLFLTSELNLQRLKKISESSKSSYPSISPDDILNLDIALPETNTLLENACHILNPIFEKFSLVQKENQHLTQLRDWLLPMLMNGQVTAV